METLFASLPILLLVTLIVLFKKSVVFSAGISLVLLILTSVWWGVSGLDIYAAGLRGLFVASEIIVIIFAALLIVEVIKRRNLFEPLQNLFQRISPDYRVQAILLAFALVYFIEGVAGFGTPAIVVVPLLITLGFKPVHSVILALIGDTIPVSFGAVGLPITFGIDSVLRGVTTESGAITSETIRLVGLLNIPLSIILSVIIVGTAIFLRKGSRREFIEMLPFAMLAGLIVSAIAFATALLVGPELPAIVGGLMGLIILIYLARKQFLIPLSARGKQPHKKLIPQEQKIFVWRALYPYILLITLLAATRIPFFHIGEQLQTITISTTKLLGGTIPYSVAPFYSAATLLLISALITLFLARKDIGSYKKPISTILKKIERPYVALIVILVFVQIFIFSDSGGSLTSMPAVIAESVSQWSGALWPFLVPFVGAFGSFLAGSATVSNVIFSGIQYDIAATLDIPPATLLSLQSVGASVGNMIALHNIIAALTIAGIKETEGHKVIRANALPLLILLIITGSIGLYMAS